MVATVVERLADRFARRLRASVTFAEYREIRRRNRIETDPHVCASHDFIDANEVMADAWADVIGTPIDPDDDEQAATWSAAWERFTKPGTDHTGGTR